jgi:hypothetical protein
VRVFHSGELGAMVQRRAPDATPAATKGSGAGIPRGADGALAVFLGPAAKHQPHRG